MVCRTEDMGTEKRLKVQRDGDGDIIVSIVTGRGMAIYNSQDDQFASVEFCTPGSGGGKSHKTWEALIALIRAMEEDEEASPDRHRPVDHFK